VEELAAHVLGLEWVTLIAALPEIQFSEMAMVVSLMAMIQQVGPFVLMEKWWEQLLRPPGSCS